MDRNFNALWIGILTPFLCLWQEFTGQNELKPNWGMDIGIVVGNKNNY
jgi:hypothetical protein